MRHTKSSWLAVSSLTLLSHAAIAQSGFYLSGAIGNSDADLDAGAYGARQKRITGDDGGFALGGGYEFNKNISVEAGYQDLGKLTGDRNLCARLVSTFRVAGANPQEPTTCRSECWLSSPVAQGTLYLLPGLADMHTHLTTPEDAALYVAAGVTSVLQMGGDRMLPINRIRAGLADGTLVGPQIFFSLKVDGPDAMSDGWPVDSPATARALVTVAKAYGFQFIKLYNSLGDEVFTALVDASREAGLAVIGHGVRAVGLPEGLFRGQVMVAHAEEFFYTAFGYKTDRAKIPDVVEKTFESKAYVTANLSAYETIAEQWGKPEKVREYLRDPRVRYMSLETRDIWVNKDYARQTGDLHPTLEFLRVFTKALADRGVPLLAGTDSPVIPGLVPGDSIDVDLRTLTDIGLTPFQALSTATRVPGEFIVKYVPGAARFGVVAPGTRADLMLVAGNPLDSLETLKKSLGVMAGGHWRTAEQLHAVLEENKARMDSAFGQSAQ